MDILGNNLTIFFSTNYYDFFLDKIMKINLEGGNNLIIITQWYNTIEIYTIKILCMKVFPA